MARLGCMCGWSKEDICNRLVITLGDGLLGGFINTSWGVIPISETLIGKVWEFRFMRFTNGLKENRHFEKYYC